jgi:hypothetical protein
MKQDNKEEPSLNNISVNDTVEVLCDIENSHSKISNIH